MVVKLVDLLVQFATFGFMIVHDEAYRQSSTLFAWCFEFACHLILSVSLSMLLVGFLVVETFIDLINALLNGIVERVKTTITQDNRISAINFKNYLTFANDIERIVQFHSYVFRLAGSLCQLYGVQFLLFVLYFLIEMVVHLFFLYFVASKMTRMDDGQEKRGPLFNPYIVVGVCSMFMDLYLLINGAHRIKEKNIQTKFILWKFARERRGLDQFENMVSGFHTNFSSTNWMF